ncbi:FAD-dependent oxidoreductase [Oceanobacillus jeddahense]|uniref:FAD-dependent oxidoreductase n=1 Tax=Oceanobacillus jeddahense TaxID=1462527 RepID=UPI000595B895|nr:NAD(P)/FAD-dependent oxidoreductase [Oceanobacillus jeddahense]
MKNKVIINGGGVAGLAMSLFLKKANIESVLYEQAKAYRKSGGHFVVHPSGLNMLEMLGLGSEVEKNTHFITDMAILDKNNNSLIDEDEMAEMGLDEIDLDDTPPFINAARYRLIDVLYQEALRQGIDIRFNKRLNGFTQDKDGVTVTFEDGSTDFGSILIGADGVKSKTRELLFPFPANPLKYSGKTAVFGMVDNDDLGKLKDYFTMDTTLMYVDENSIFFVSKHHPSAEEISWSLISERPGKLPKKDFEEKPVKELKKDIASKFEDWEMPIKELVMTTDHIIAKQLYMIDLMRHYYHGRVVLIGDALHTADPFAGMGTTLALEDAMYLAKMLRDNDYEDAFYYYEHDRKPRAEKVYKSAELINDPDAKFEDFAIFDEGIDAVW